jgi:uncharacterized protein (TIGR03643 family)
MGKSSLDIIQENNFTERQLNRIIEMAWEDRTPFEAITFQFSIPEKEVIKLHLNKRNQDITRFKCSRQRAITGNKISKR